MKSFTQIEIIIRCERLPAIYKEHVTGADKKMISLYSFFKIIILKNTYSTPCNTPCVEHPSVADFCNSTACNTPRVADPSVADFCNSTTRNTPCVAGHRVADFATVLPVTLHVLLKSVLEILIRIISMPLS